MKKCFWVLIFLANQIWAQQPDPEGSLVKWMTLKEAMAKQKIQPKPMIVDFYTDWCGWCKRMMKTTYADVNLAQYINTYFYPVKFDAEGKDTVDYLGEKYLPVSKEPRTPHSLAVKLLNNKLVYPTTLFLNGYDDAKNEFKLSMIATGYLEPDKLEPILIFILENAGRNSSYDDFKFNFEITYRDSTLPERLKTISWIEPKKAFADTTAGKKSLVMINTGWCNTCKVMKSTSFTDTSLVKYLTEKFTLINFDPEITDSIYFKGQLFTNPKNPQMPFHQLAFALGKNSINFPSLIVLDENKNVMDVIPSYIPPGFLNEIIHYYGDNKYKNKSWADYMKELGKNN